MKPNFKIIKEDSKTKARLGILNTAHGKVMTPSYVIVGTHAEVKRIDKKEISKTKTQIIISNTYHLWNRILKKKKIEKSWVHNQLGRKMPIMTDSGGFQVFSLGFGRENKVGKILKSEIKNKENIKREKIKITSKGVYFKIDNETKFLGPKESMELQKRIGADIVFAFDECTSPLDNEEYNRKALTRTHNWAKQCLDFKLQDYQMLFGIVQGGKYKNLRIESAKKIGSLPFNGFGIGGSFGKDQMVKVLKWITPYLPKEKPRHLLGVGRVEDIFNAVENGMDLFDCVIPTREGRHGRLWTNEGIIDIRKGRFSKDKSKPSKTCKCLVCATYKKRDINELIKSSEMNKKEKGQSLATFHNIFFFNNLLENIRESIAKDGYLEFKKKFLLSFQSLNDGQISRDASR